MEAKYRIKPDPTFDLPLISGVVLFCAMGIFVLLSDSSVIAVVFAVLFIGIGVMIGVFALSGYLASRSALNTFRHSPMTSQATILDRQVQVSKDRYSEREYRTYWVVFRFDAGEEQVTLKARVSRFFYGSVGPGTTVTVRYAATNPCIALLEGEDGYRQATKAA